MIIFSRLYEFKIYISKRAYHIYTKIFIVNTSEALVSFLEMFPHLIIMFFQV